MKCKECQNYDYYLQKYVSDEYCGYSKIPCDHCLYNTLTEDNFIKIDKTYLNDINSKNLAVEIIKSIEKRITWKHEIDIRGYFYTIKDIIFKYLEDINENKINQD